MSWLNVAKNFVSFQFQSSQVLKKTFDGGEHPFHLHGHNFWIIATSDYPDAEDLYKNDYIQRDTVSVPGSGWVKIRFLADNPGAWFFHCHIEWHMSAGLALAFLVSPDQLIANGFKISSEQRSLCRALKQFNGKNQTNSNFH
ncbi:unnamed protein product [Adineta ricciae]|uniref:Plastocyanin-like domain-containing protein n=1 Tax=Adineta ricciae TaxID=249248 RepID=A0A813UU48_ADIRI|nr:unnamed protein product [Adineta ricciae]CAF0977962.1 unnamed protein product [Adineta ricciae]